MDRSDTSGNPAETAANHAETQRDSGYGCTPTSLQDLFEPSIRALHGIEANEAAHRGITSPAILRSVGTTWIIDPRVGEGTYWYHALDEYSAISSMEMTFTCDQMIDCHTMDFFCFGAYGQTMPSYFLTCPPCSGTALIGYAWKASPYQLVLRAGDRFVATSITLLPSALPGLAQQFGCCPLDIAHAIARLDGRHDIYGLPAALRELSAARPRKQSAAAYYRAKLVEALALLIDGMEQPASPKPSTGADDLACVSRACAYIESHLSSDLTTKNISHIVHLSEGKLIAAFKRVKGVLPQEFIRELRMERARKLLTDETYLIRAIAFHVGYSNQGGFTDAFRHAYGVSPSHYRKHCRRDQQQEALRFSSPRSISSWRL